MANLLETDVCMFVFMKKQVPAHQQKRKGILSTIENETLDLFPLGILWFNEMLLTCTFVKFCFYSPQNAKTMLARQFLYQSLS